MSKSAFEAYPRTTAARLVLLMGITGAVLVVEGFLADFATFWAAGSILVLFAVASWPKQEEEPHSAALSPDSPAVVPSNAPRRADELKADDTTAIFASAKTQLERLRREVARRRRENDTGLK
ncbi:MAG TPA: hypothetical protein VJL29_02115 [Thermoguttaceae bacterium]|nr:hypothetical protein [Thermoguttaceae bacterium]